MARQKRQFEESDLLRELSEQLLDKFDYLLGEINLNDIYFAFCVSDSSKKSKPLIMGNISNELAQKVANSKYQIAFYSDKWQEWSEEKQILMLFNALYSIDPSSDGKLRRNDIVGHYIMFKTFGLEWEQLDDCFPNIIVDPVQFKMPIEEEIDENIDTVKNEELDSFENDDIVPF